MLIAFIVQVAICILILRWLLKKKTGRPFTKKMVARLLGAGMIAVVACFGISLALHIKRDTFFGLNPILAGFLTALLTAALFEELVKYITFRLALVKNREVISWLDVIIAAIIVGMGFTLLEDAEFAVAGSTNILRAIIPGHLLFQGIMGYYYGKARVTKKRFYDVLSLAVPILVHTLFDMFLIALMSILGDVNALLTLSEEEIVGIPYWGYVVPLLVCALATFVFTMVATIILFRKITVWSKKSEKQEALHQ